MARAGISCCGLFDNTSTETAVLHVLGAAACVFPCAETLDVLCDHAHSVAACHSLARHVAATDAFSRVRKVVYAADVAFSRPEAGGEFALEPAHVDHDYPKILWPAV